MHMSVFYTGNKSFEKQLVPFPTVFYFVAVLIVTQGLDSTMH